MFKRMLAIMAVFWVTAVSAAPVPDYEKSYTEVAKTASPEPELRLFMSYWCGHCYALQGIFNTIREHYAGRVRFVVNPISLLGGADAPLAQRGYALAHLKGVSQGYSQQLFALVQDEGKKPLAEDDMLRIFGKLGIGAEDYRAEIASFVVEGMVRTFDEEAERIELDAVPTLVVNGRYEVNIEAFDRPGHAIAVIDYLLGKK